jgi:hypothetical protein
MLISVQYEGDAIRKKVQELYTQYKVETEKVTAISTKFGLDTTQEEKGLVEFEQYVQEIDSNRNLQDDMNRAIGPPINGTARLSFVMHPDHGVYGDLIDCFGYYFSGNGAGDASDREVTVFLDSAPFSTQKTDEQGRYTATIPVEHLAAGPHSLSAQSGTTVSDTLNLTISAVDSATTLVVTRPDSNGDVTCTGTVIANLPVRSAPVQLVWDTTHITETSTDTGGQFRTTLRLPDGRHTVVARFSGEGYPISASESTPQVVDVSPLRIIPFNTIAGILLILTVILLLFAGIAWYYLRRTPGRRIFNLSSEREPPLPGIPARDSTELEGEPGAEVPPGDSSFLHDEPLTARYARILKEEGMSAAAWAVYRQFAGHLARTLVIPRHTTLTPRELSRSCMQKPFCEAFSSFVNTYEQIRYGGQRSVAIQEEFEDRMDATKAEMEDGLS